MSNRYLFHNWEKEKETMQIDQIHFESANLRVLNEADREVRRQLADARAQLQRLETTQSKIQAELRARQGSLFPDLDTAAADPLFA